MRLQRQADGRIARRFGAQRLGTERDGQWIAGCETALVEHLQCARVEALADDASVELRRSRGAEAGGIGATQRQPFDRLDPRRQLVGELVAEAGEIFVTPRRAQREQLDRPPCQIDIAGIAGLAEPAGLLRAEAGEAVGVGRQPRRRARSDRIGGRVAGTDDIALDPPLAAKGDVQRIDATDR